MDNDAILQELAQASWHRHHEEYYNARVDDVLLGATVARLVRSGHALIGINSDGANHHVRLEHPDQPVRILIRLTNLSEDLTVARVRGRHASLIVGYGERVEDLASVWPRFEPEAKSLYSPAWEPGIISFDADLAARFLYAQISLILDLDRYLGEDFMADLDLFGTHLEGLLQSLKRYLRGRLGRGEHDTAPPFQPDRRESRQEIRMGQIIAAMSEAGFPVMGLVTDEDSRRVRFRAQQDDVLFAVVVGLRSERVFRNSGDTIICQAEIKNYLADTRQLLSLHEQLQGLPAGMSYRMNSVYARADQAWPGEEALAARLGETIEQLKTQLAPYKKSLSPFSQKVQRLRRAGSPSTES